MDSCHTVYVRDTTSNQTQLGVEDGRTQICCVSTIKCNTYCVTCSLHVDTFMHMSWLMEGGIPHVALIRPCIMLCTCNLLLGYSIIEPLPTSGDLFDSPDYSHRTCQGGQSRCNHQDWYLHYNGLISIGRLHYTVKHLCVLVYVWFHTFLVSM